MAYDPITDDQRSRVRRKLSITEAIYSDEEIDDVYDEAEGVMTLVYVYLLDELMADAAKLYNYTQNTTREEQGQVFENLQNLRKMYYDRYMDERERGRRKVRFFTAKMTSKTRDVPYEQDELLARDIDLPNPPDRSR